MDYEFEAMSEFTTTGALKTDLYEVLVLELSHYMAKRYYAKMDELYQYYDSFLIDYYEAEVQIYSRVNKGLKECSDKSLIKYVKDYNNSFDKSFFSYGYVKEVEASMRILTRFDSLINKFALDIMVKYSLMNTPDPTDPHLAICLYFERAKNPLYMSFTAFLETCENFVSEVVR